MPLNRLGIKKPIAIELAILLSLGIRPSKSEANPAMLLAPELCATGIGCVVGAVIVVGGVAYIIQQRNGHKVLIPKDTGVTYSRPLSGIEAVKMGDAHWAREVTDCYKIGKRIGKKPKAHYPAIQHPDLKRDFGVSSQANKQVLTRGQNEQSKKCC